jgi:hypothetical protein
MRASSRLASPYAIALALAAALATGGQAIADQVIPDDLIVQGSLCVGLDCVNNENFGFDTIILKENNTRILFNDTSVQAGFPANDWRLIANDSASGGSSLFAIEDATAARRLLTLTAGAAANSIFVDSTGRVGFRTSTPVLDLHVSTSNTPAHRLEQTNAGGFTAQTWDIAGNEANFFVRDVTSGSRLPFRIRPGAPTSSIDISADGDVGMRTASPAINLDVRSDAATTASVLGSSNSNNTSYLSVFSGRDTNDPALIFPSAKALRFGFGDYPGAVSFTERARITTAGGFQVTQLPNCANGIITNGSGLMSCAASSRLFKTVTGDLPHQVALANVMALKPQIGAYKETPDVPEHWFIAEEVAAVDPALVGLHDGKPYTVKTTNVVADLVAVVQQQQKRIDELERLLKQKTDGR